MTGALLGLLLERPGYGYELAQRLNERMGPTWKLTPSSIYPVLDRLEGRGLVRRTVKDLSGRQRQRERVMYHATDAAAGAFQAWLSGPSQREPIRTELLAKLAVARPEDADRLLGALDQYERECRSLLGAASGAEPSQLGSWDALLAGLLERAAGDQLRTELDWVAFARERIGRFAGEADRP